MIEFLFWVFFAYVVYFYIYEYLDKQKSPPGPLPLPILGNLLNVPLADSVPSLAFAKIGKKYGDVFQLRMGMKTIIIPTTVESISTLFSAPEAQARDVSGTFYDRNFRRSDLGIVFANGPLQIATKQWTMKALKEFGFGKSSGMEATTYEGLEELFKDIDQKCAENGNIVLITDLFILSVFKNVWKLVVGHLNEEDEEVVKDLLEKSEAAIRKGVMGAGTVVAFPWTRHIFPENTGHKEFMEFYTTAWKAARGLLSQAQQTFEDYENHQPQTLVEAFAGKMREEKGIRNKESIFTEKSFICIYMDLMQAGSDTTSSYLESFVLFMVLYPEVQQSIYEEIQRVVPEGENVNLTHRPKMIYTQACLLEAHRHAKVVQALVPREVQKDFHYRKYLIKKGNVLIANLHSAYFSEDVWEDPYSFKPERFIGTNGQLINQSNVMAFGFGKRICPGEALSHSTLFLYVTCLLQRYKISTVPGEPKPRAELQEGFTTKPYPFKVLFTRRKQAEENLF